jgi:phospholipid/cholesterol/gamma-HCH transport system permease protein
VSAAPIGRPARSPVPNTSGDRGWSVRPDPSGATIVLTGDWIAREAGEVEAASAPRVLEGARDVRFDANGLGQWDSALLVFLLALRHEAQKLGIRFDTAGLPEAASRLLALTAETVATPGPARARPRLTDRVGRAVLGFSGEAASVLAIIGDTVLRGAAAFVGKVRMRRVDLLNCTYDAGMAALPIVTIVNILVGGILAFVGAVQLSKFGADIYIAALVGIAMTREMAALMTAIVMSGRTGGAFAAEISTMVGNEEIDALRAIGIPVYDYLILPRVLALTFMMPMLYLYGCAVGIFGGFLVAVAMLNISPEGFLEQIRLSVAGDQVVFGLLKSVAFGALIAITGCRFGLKAGRGAADVGQAATSAVVYGIVGVIALDAVFAVCAHALDF